jgi:serine/threonine protein kinase
MAENSSGSPLFAGRYRFQSVGNDWDRGRSGYTHLVFDIKKERLGVIKRAETESQRAVEGLKNEVGVLLDLKGLGVPEVYDTGEAEYGSKNYFYMVIEYIEGIRVEKNLDALGAVERAEILTQLFGMLASAHKMGIVNGDIDLKHLFWRRDKRQLVIIDWGNARPHVDPKNKTEFVFDLARSAEIIYALVTPKGQRRATGSLALPNDFELLVGLAPVPNEFRTLCKWAPHTPGVDMQAPYTAQELFDTARGWRKGVPYKRIKKPNRVLPFLLAAMVLAGLFLTLFPGSPFYPMIFPRTATPLASITSAPTTAEVIQPTGTEVITQPTTEPPVPTDAATSAPSETLPSTLTSLSVVTPTPLTYTDASTALLLDKDYSSGACWVPFSASSLGSQDNQNGLTRRGDRNWRFGTFKGYPADTSLEVDFRPCMKGKNLSGVGLNVWVGQLKIEPASQSQPEELKPEDEFGFFIEYTKEQRREYTIWVDNNASLHVRVRENSEIVLDEVRAVVNNLSLTKSFPRSSATFSIRIFLEIDNGKLDILYLDGGSLTQAPGTTNDFVLSDVTRVDHAVRPDLGEIQKIGLIGYGGATQTIIWPLVFFGE